MSGAIVVEVTGLNELADGRFVLGQGADWSELMTLLAAALESQTRRRITEDKEDPSGTSWPGWSERYAATRGSGHSLLEADGSLVDSMVSEGGPDTALVGSHLPYAAIHNFGGTDDMAPGPAGVPAREYLGLSDDDAEEILSITEGWLLGQAGVA